MTNPKTLEELREQLGMKPTQLLTNPNGELGDLLSFDGTTARIGILSTGQIVLVPVKYLLPKEEENV